MENFSFTQFLEYLPKVLQELDSKEQLIGLALLVLPILVWLGMRDMVPWRRGVLTIVGFFGVLTAMYLTLEPQARQLAQEVSAPTAKIDLEEVRRIATAQDASGQILPDSGTRALTLTDLAGLDKTALSLARNEIFARKGRYFRSKHLQEHFAQFDWYQPNTWDPKLTATELANVKLIQQAEGN